MSSGITEDMIARQPAETQGIIRVLLAHIAPLDRRIGVLEMELAVLRETSRNSSLPPSSEHPSAKPDPLRKKRSGQAMSVIMSGGGMSTGQIVGSTNSTGEPPSNRPLTSNDL